MKWWNQHSRVNLEELKTLIVKKVGVEKSKLYFYYLSKFLNMKLSKVNFNKLCFRVLGKENIPLHNQLICSILKNACTAKAAPHTSHKTKVSTPNSGSSYTFSNEKKDFGSHHSTITEDNIASEDGLQKLVQHHQVFSESTERDGSVSVVENKNEISAMSAVVAPLGIPFCKASVGQPLAGIHRFAGSYDTGALLGSYSLRERMQQIAASLGLDGVSVDSANLLNRGLDLYLKRLIKSSVELVGASSGSDMIVKDSYLHNSQGKIANGMQVQRSHLAVSLLDFKVAMQLTPQQLGENWPFSMEKIMDSFEE